MASRSRPSTKGRATTKAGKKGGGRKRAAPAKGKRGSKSKADPPVVPPEPWEQQPGEGAKAFRAFAVYRDLGPDEQSVRRVARELHKSVTLIGQWSSKWRWVERAKAWNMEQDRTRQRELELAQIEAARRHAETLQRHLSATDRITEAFLAKLAGKEGKEWLEKLSADELATLAIQAARVAPRLVPAERLSVGLSTTNVGGHTGGPVEIDPDARARARTDEELRAFLLGADTASSIEGGDS